MDTPQTNVPSNPGGHTTLSPPFVTSDTIYFRGVDNRLLAVGITSGDTTDLNNETVTTPFVSGERVYFMGVDNALKAVSTDGKQNYELRNTTASAPCVKNTWLVFRGTDDRLLRLDLTDPNAPAFDYGETTVSSPVIDGDTVYFHGSDDRLLAIPLSSGVVRELGGKTAAAPAVADGMVVFKEPGEYGHADWPSNKSWTAADGRLMYVPTTGGQPKQVGDNITPSGPAAAAGWVYFRGERDDALRRCRYDGSDQEQIGNAQVWSTPAANGLQVAWQGVNDNKLWYIALA